MMTPSAKSPTILDIARQLGISHSTVSRALRGTGRMSHQLRTKIQNEAQRIGYVRNTAAVALRYRASHLIGFLANSFFSFTIDELLAEIQREAHQRNFGILTGNSTLDPAKEISLLRFMASKQVAGIIMQSVSPGTPIFQEELQRLIQDNIRVVHLLDVVSVPGVYSVVVDNRQAGYLAGRHLLELGHRRILFLADDSPNRRWPRKFSSERYAGLLRAYQEMGIPRPPDLIANVSAQYPGYETMHEILDRGLNFTAVFAYSDQVAVGAIITLKERGYQVPGNCSVIGFADSQFTKTFIKPQLTTIRLPYDQVGAKSIGLILNNDPKIWEECHDDVITIQPSLIVRESTLPLDQTRPIGNRS